LTAAYFHQSADDVPDYGLPWFGSVPAPVPRRNFYGFTSDFLNTDVDVVTLKAGHDYSARATVVNQLRYAQYVRDFRISEPIITAPLGTPLSTVAVSRNIFGGNSTETMIWDQADMTLHFDTGPVQHSVVAGIEGGRETSKPEFDNSSGVPTVPLFNPDPHLPFVAASTFPRFKADTTGTSFGVYAIDTVKLSEQWELNLGLRWDYFDADYKATDSSLVTTRWCGSTACRAIALRWFTNPRRTAASIWITGHRSIHPPRRFPSSSVRGHSVSAMRFWRRKGTKLSSSAPNGTS
jgi:catecholate siderophore receptor